MRRQHGLTMTGFLVTAVILVIVALLGFQIAPPYMEYYTIKKQIKLVANELTATDRRTVENAFDRRAVVENITAISAKDLEITKDGDKVVLSVDYSVKVPLVKNLNACMDFSVSSDK
jgi:Tfp pilus assembly major pilin PilA